MSVYFFLALPVNTWLFMISRCCTESDLRQTAPPLPDPHPQQDNRYPRWNDLEASDDRSLCDCFDYNAVSLLFRFSFTAGARYRA